MKIDLPTVQQVFTDNHGNHFFRGGVNVTANDGHETRYAVKTKPNSHIADVVMIKSGNEWVPANDTDTTHLVGQFFTEFLDALGGAFIAHKGDTRVSPRYDINRMTWYDKRAMVSITSFSGVVGGEFIKVNGMTYQRRQLDQSKDWQVFIPTPSERKAIMAIKSGAESYLSSKMTAIKYQRQRQSAYF